MESRKRKMRVLMLEDDEREVLRFARYAALCDDVEFLGATGSCREGMERTSLSRPDAVILDLELREGHGIDYLNAMNEQRLGCRPVVVVVTAVSAAYTLRAVHRRGADRIIYKEAEDYRRDGPAILVDFLRELELDEGETESERKTDHELLRRRIQMELSHLSGAMGNVTLSYLVEAILVVSQMPPGPVNFSRDVYPAVSLRFGKNLNSVKRGISYSVTQMYNSVDRAALEQAYQPQLKESTGMAEAKQFVIYFADRFRGGV